MQADDQVLARNAYQLLCEAPAFVSKQKQKLSQQGMQNPADEVVHQEKSWCGLLEAEGAGEIVHVKRKKRKLENGQAQAVSLLLVG